VSEPAGAVEVALLVVVVAWLALWLAGVVWQAKTGVREARGRRAVQVCWLVFVCGLGLALYAHFERGSGTWTWVWGGVAAVGALGTIILPEMYGRGGRTNHDERHST
jgi:hypothetical protein